MNKSFPEVVAAAHEHAPRYCLPAYVLVYVRLREHAVIYSAEVLSCIFQVKAPTFGLVALRCTKTGGRSQRLFEEVDGKSSRLFYSSVFGTFLRSWL